MIKISWTNDEGSPCAVFQFQIALWGLPRIKQYPVLYIRFLYIAFRSGALLQLVFVSYLYENVASFYHPDSLVLDNAFDFHFCVCSAVPIVIPRPFMTIVYSGNEKGKTRRMSFRGVFVSLQNNVAVSRAWSRCSGWDDRNYFLQTEIPRTSAKETEDVCEVRCRLSLMKDCVPWMPVLGGSRQTGFLQTALK